MDLAGILTELLSHTEGPGDREHQELKNFASYEPPPLRYNRIESGDSPACAKPRYGFPCKERIYPKRTKRISYSTHTFLCEVDKMRDSIDYRTQM